MQTINKKFRKNRRLIRKYQHEKNVKIKKNNKGKKCASNKEEENKDLPNETSKNGNKTF